MVFLLTRCDSARDGSAMATERRYGYAAGAVGVKLVWFLMVFGVCPKEPKALKVDRW